MIILGIDPGSRITGYGLIEKKGNTLLHVDNGLIRCDREPDFNQRLVAIFNAVGSLIKKFSPEVAAIENIFYSKNVQSTLKLGHARGAAIVASRVAGLPVFEYTPLEIKKAVAGYGVAPKEQMQKMVKALLKLPELAEENASDALAVAICHANSCGLNNLLAIAAQKR